MDLHIKARFVFLSVLACASFFYFSVVAQAQSPTLKELQTRSQSGDIVAMRELGTAYGEGRLVEKQDFKQAVYWLEKAANGGDREAMSKVGWLYDQGDGVDQNLTTAIKWYEKAAALGDSVSCYNLGYIYEQGRGVGRSFESAFKWYKKGADLGDPASMEVVAAYYKAGLGVTKNDEKSNEWLEKVNEANERLSKKEDLDILRGVGLDAHTGTEKPANSGNKPSAATKPAIDTNKSINAGKKPLETIKQVETVKPTEIENPPNSDDDDGSELSLEDLLKEN